MYSNGEKQNIGKFCDKINQPVENKKSVKLAYRLF